MFREERMPEQQLIPVNHTQVNGVEPGLEAIYLLDKVKLSPNSSIYFAPNEIEIANIAKLAKFFCKGLKVITLPAWDTIPYDRSSPNRDILAKRAASLVELAKNVSIAKERLLVLTTARAAIQKLPSHKQLKDRMLNLKKGDVIKLSDLNYYLQSLGYFRCGKITDIGEYSIRGDIIDVYSSYDSAAYRIELFGDEIEEIRLIDAIKQTSVKKVESCNISLISEVTLNPSQIDLFLTNYKKQFGLPKEQDYMYHAISQQQSYPGYENFLPLFNDGLSSLFDYSDKPELYFCNEAITQIDEFFIDIDDYYKARLNHLEEAKRVKKQIVKEVGLYQPLKPNQLYYSPSMWLEKLEQYKVLRFSQFSDKVQDAKNIASYSSFKHMVKAAGKTNPMEKLQTHFRQVKDNNQRLAIACFSVGAASHMLDLLEKYKLQCQKVTSFSELEKLGTDKIAVIVLPVRQSVLYGQIVLLSEIDILGDRYRAKQKRKKPVGDIFTANRLYEPGELVIHKGHGLGRFVGLEQLAVQNTVHDMLKLEYLGGDRLFVPVENMDLVTAYGNDSGNRELDKLGGAGWKAKKAKLDEKIKLAADELLTMAAKRKLNTAVKIVLDPEPYDKFARGFPFTETEDQQNAIADIFADLEIGKPMDRLICGDVGFGKTEVAMRAAFAAAIMGKQVLVICPTTILCRQHYYNFIERFSGFDEIEIKQMSRLVPNVQIKQVKQELSKSNKPLIVVGTHALLAEDFQANNLGLVIVDEEQHFGVAQKEKLKKLGENCHYLSLSATPIPRTLQLSLAGVKSLSIIATPPVDRLPVKTFVAPFDPVIIREAILREKNRAGRCFYVVPRIKDIDKLYGELKLLLPEISIGVAHGQLPVTKLEEIMNDFYEGKYDMLLSTAIVESGLDVKTANTMIIHRSDNFGLSALYQLRGRVGRGKTKAYCYLTLEHGKIYTKQALKRLEVMQGLNTLGAGFSVASHDMDIRGYGNVLGEEQSGHIKEVGVELYQQMLNEAVAKAKAVGEGNKAAITGEEDFSPIINFGLSVVIPDNYIQDLSSRMELYKKASSITDFEEITDLQIELADRFGEIPEEIHSFIKTIELKVLCKKAGVEKLDSGPKAVTLKIRDNFHDHEKLLGHIMQNHLRLKLRPDGKIVVSCQSYQTEERLQEIIEDLQQLKMLAS